MRKMSIAALLLTGTMAASAQNNTLRGSGNVVTRDVSIKPFTAIKAGGMFDLVLTQGSIESVKVETDDNLQNLFEISNDGETLVIDEPKLRDHSLNFSYKDDEDKGKKQQHFKIYITFKNITSLNLQLIGNTHNEGSINLDALDLDDWSVGNITLTLATKEMKVKNKGVGNINLSGSVDNAIVINSGVGSFDGSNFVAQTMDIKNTGIGHADVNVVKNLIIQDSFLGKVHNSGSAKTLKLDKVEI